MTNDMQALARSISDTVKGYFADTFTGIQSKLADLEQRIGAIPKPKDGEPGKDAPPIDEKAIVQHILGLIPAPKDGKDGKDGLPGKDGVNGVDGMTGATGTDGENGKDAPIIDEAALVQRIAAMIPRAKDGETGKDAAPIDYLRLSQIIREEVDARVKLIPLPEKGDKGDKGDPGEKGRDGDTIRGDKGEQGERGESGKDGEHGRDALEARIVHGLDETRSYPRGTYAIHRNALLRALRPTGPMNGSVENAGWEVLFAGVTNVSAQLGKDDRTLELSLESAGETFKSAIALPIPVDRGVWKAGPYRRGDGVTRNGSFWIAQRDTEQTPGGFAVSPDWRLAVKGKAS